MQRESEIDDWLIDVLRCPNSGEPLELASAELVDELNARLVEGTLLNNLGVPSDLNFDSGMVNRSKTFFYGISNQIPTLIPGESIPLRE